MINFSQGQIHLGTAILRVAADYNELDALADKGSIEKRKGGGANGTYFYVEVEDGGMRFGIFVSLRGEKIEWLLLRWLDGPCTSKGWDGVSETALRDEYRRLLNFVEERSGVPPNHKKNRERRWRFNWGHVDVSYELRSFDAAIFMVPR